MLSASFASGSHYFHSFLDTMPRLGPHALLSSLLQRRRSRLHIEASICRRLLTPVERLMKPPW